MLMWPVGAEEFRKIQRSTKLEGEHKAKHQALSQTLDRKFFSDFSNEKTVQLRSRFINLLIQPIFRELLLRAGSCGCCCSYRYEEAGELPSQVCRIVSFLVPCFLLIMSGSLQAVSTFVWFPSYFKYLKISKPFPIALNSSVNSYSRIGAGKKGSLLSPREKTPQAYSSGKLMCECSSLNILYLIFFP